MNAPIVASPQRRRLRPATIAQFLALTLIWGSTWLVIKHQIGVVPIAWSVSYRFIIAGVAMVALCLLLRRSLVLPWQGHVIALLVAAFQFLANFNFVYQSERYLTSGLVALVFALLIVPNTVLARIFLGQRIAPLFVVGSALGIVGVALLVARDLVVEGAGVATGLAFIVTAVLCASIGNVLQATQRARALPLEPLLAISLLYGGGLTAVAAFVTTGPPVFDSRPEYIGGVLYLAVVASMLAFRLYYALIREIGPARAGYVNVIVPLIAMTLSTVFENYQWTWTAAAGAALTLTGLAIALRSRG